MFYVNSFRSFTMSLYIKQLKYTKSAQMNTEVLFEIAGARADGCSVVRLDLPFSEECGVSEKASLTLKRIIRSIKKRGTVQFFVSKDDILHSTTEARYLMNVFPEVENNIPSSGFFVFIKL